MKGCWTLGAGLLGGTMIGAAAVTGLYAQGTCSLRSTSSYDATGNALAVGRKYRARIP
jgi:hypothetical protein